MPASEQASILVAMAAVVFILVAFFRFTAARNASLWLGQTDVYSRAERSAEQA
ncbi:MAG: hypothetical protein AAFN10_10085 [Bacteroidota bacterium]